MNPQPDPAVPRFEVTPYQPDGGAPARSCLLLVVLGAVTGALLGLVAAYVSQWIYLILIFPLIIGAAVGGVTALGIRRAKIRNPFVGGLAGLFGGVAAMFVMHYTEFQRFKGDITEEERQARIELGKLTPEQLQALYPWAPPEAIRQLKDPLHQKALRVETFPEYMDFQAEQGVTLSKVGPGNDPGMNLGYTGSWVYWILEAFVVAFVALGISRGAATQPFCTNCHSWKTFAHLGGMDFTDEAVAGFLTGDLGALRTARPRPEAGPLVVSVSLCPHCQADSTVDVKMSRMTYDKKGAVTGMRPVGHLTYPGASLPVWLGLFQSPAPEPPPVAEAAEGGGDSVGDEPSSLDGSRSPEQTS